MPLPIDPRRQSPSEPAFGPDHTPFDAIGGAERVRALVDAFYEHMEGDADLRPTFGLYPADTGPSRERLYEFLVGWLGGPPLYVQKHGHPRLRMRHAPFPIGEQERDHWLTSMGRAMDDCGVDGDLRRFLEARFAHVADFMRNT